MLSPLLPRRWYPGPLGYWWARLERRRINKSSAASDPGKLTLSMDKLRRLSPHLFPSLWRPIRLLRWLFGPSTAEVYWIKDLLVHGDSRAAVVMRTEPLLVACYTDELDAIALLRFPAEFAQDHRLIEGSRLLTVLNTCYENRLAPDLEHGPGSYRRCENFMPFVAEFLSDDWQRIDERKQEIAEAEWEATWELGLRYLDKFGEFARDGRPPYNRTPAPLSRC